MGGEEDAEARRWRGVPAVCAELAEGSRGS